MNILKSLAIAIAITTPAAATELTDKFLTTLRREPGQDAIFTAFGVMRFVTSKCVGKGMDYTFASKELLIATAISMQPDFISGMTRQEWHSMKTGEETMAALFGKVSKEEFCAGSMVAFDFLAVKS